MTTTSRPGEDAPLAGMNVVEASSYVSGPFAALALADLGAQVTKIEPLAGDPYRRFGPQDEHPAGGPMFRAVNRNKTSRFLDLKSPAGVTALHALLDEADVLLSNWRPAVAAGFGLHPDNVETRWPRLVWVRVSGYGQDGPMADMPAFDSVIQARSGMLSTPDGPNPELFPMYLVDKVTAMTAVHAALAGLLRRSSTGKGSVADIAMLDAAAYFNVPDVSAGHQSPDHPDLRVQRHLSVPRPLPTKDGSIVVSPVTGRQLKRALEVAGIGTQAVRLKEMRDATSMARTFYEEMASALETESTDHWIRRFADADVPVTRVLAVEEHLLDPQVVHNRMYRPATEPNGRKTIRPRFPVLFDGKAVSTEDFPVPPLP